MYRALSTFLAVAAVATTGYAQTIYRCAGNVYTNDRAEAQAKGCKIMEGGNITVVEGTRVNGASSAPPPNNPLATPGSAPSQRVATAPQTAGSSGQRIDSDQQRSRDAEARTILEAELKKAETRQAELLKEYNNGEPEKLGPETRNHQKYLDRVAELKANIARSESDIAGLKRELSRLR